MTKAELARIQGWRLKVVQQGCEGSRNVARACTRDGQAAVFRGRPPRAPLAREAAAFAALVRRPSSAPVPTSDTRLPDAKVSTRATAISARRAGRRQPRARIASSTASPAG